MDRKRDSRSRDMRRDAVQSTSSTADKSSRLRMDAYSGRNARSKPSPPRRKEIDNVMKKARRDGTVQSQYWNKKLLEVEEKDPNRWRHSGYKELYGEKSSSRSKSRSPAPSKRPQPSKPRTGPRSPPLPSSSRARPKSRSRSYSPARGSAAGSKTSRPGPRGRPPSPPSKPSGSRPRSPASASGSESLSSCSDDSCSVCSPKHSKKKAPPRSRSRSFSVPRSRPSGPSSSKPPPPKPGSKTSSATIGRKPPPKDRPRLEAARSMRERSSPPRDPRAPPSPPRSKVRKEPPPAEKSVSKRKMLATVKIEGQPKKKRPTRPGSPPESESDSDSSSSDASGAGAPRLTLSERFGKMAQWSVDRRDIDSVKNMRITKNSDSADFKVVIEGPDEEELYRAGAPEFTDRRIGAGFFPEAMHSAPSGLSAWDDVRTRFKYYKGMGYLRDLTLDDYMKWEDWWYKYQDWLEAERAVEHWTNIRSRHRGRRYNSKM